MSGSALLDQIHAERLAFRKTAWTAPKKPVPAAPKAPPAPFPALLSFAENSGGAPHSLETAGRAICDLARAPDSIDNIQKLVARHFNVSRGDILSARRTASVVRARQIAMYLARLLTPRSLPEIARRFGGCHHTTVLHAVRKIGGAIEADAALAAEIVSLIGNPGGLRRESLAVEGRP